MRDRVQRLKLSSLLVSLGGSQLHSNALATQSPRVKDAPFPGMNFSPHHPESRIIISAELGTRLCDAVTHHHHWVRRRRQIHVFHQCVFLGVIREIDDVDVKGSARLVSGPDACLAAPIEPTLGNHRRHLAVAFMCVWF